MWKEDVRGKHLTTVADFKRWLECGTEDHKYSNDKTSKVITSAGDYNAKYKGHVKRRVINVKRNSKR